MSSSDTSPLRFTVVTSVTKNVHMTTLVVVHNVTLGDQSLVSNYPIQTSVAFTAGKELYLRDRRRLSVRYLST